MPFPAAAAVVAGGQILTSGINAASQGSMNRKTRKFTRENMNIQRDWALEDWDKQNAYNSPEAQMARYKQAKLNPNLIYGQTNTADAVRSSPAADWNPRAPEVNLDAAPVMSAYWDAKLKPLQTDLLAAQARNADLQGLLTAAQTNNTNADTASKLVNTDTSKFNLKMAQALEPISLQTKEWELNKLKADTTYTLDNNQRQAVMNLGNLREQIQRITSMEIQNSKTNAEKAKIRIETENLLKDGKLKDIEIKLRESGLSPNSSDWLKVLELQLGLIPSLKKSYNEFKDFKNKYSRPRIDLKTGRQWYESDEK